MLQIPKDNKDLFHGVNLFFVAKWKKFSPKKTFASALKHFMNMVHLYNYGVESGLKNKMENNM
jgi:hypothetical protein